MLNYKIIAHNSKTYLPKYWVMHSSCHVLPPTLKSEITFWNSYSHLVLIIFSISLYQHGFYKKTTVNMWDNNIVTKHIYLYHKKHNNFDFLFLLLRSKKLLRFKIPFISLICCDYKFVYWVSEAR